MTVFSWPCFLAEPIEGYPVDFRPIEIGNSVSIAWRVFVGAGAKIGDGAVIGANSFVNHTIPPLCLATGSPARVVAHAPYFPRRLRDTDRVTMLHNILGEMMEYLRGYDVSCRNGSDDIEIAWRRRRWFSWTERSEKSAYHHHRSRRFQIPFSCRGHKRLFESSEHSS